MRTTEIFCDGPGCSHSDADKNGSTEWIRYQKGRVKKDVHVEACASTWIAEQPKQLRLE